FPPFAERGFFRLPGRRDLLPRIPGFEREALPVAAEEQVDGGPVGDELVFLRSPCEPRAGEVAERRKYGQTGPHRPECRAVGDVKLHATAILTRELLESGPEPRRAESHAR